MVREQRLLEPVAPVMLELPDLMERLVGRLLLDLFYLRLEEVAELVEVLDQQQLTRLLLMGLRELMAV